MPIIVIFILGCVWFWVSDMVEAARLFDRGVAESVNVDALRREIGSLRPGAGWRAGQRAVTWQVDFGDDGRCHILDPGDLEKDDKVQRLKNADTRQVFYLEAGAGAGMVARMEGLICTAGGGIGAWLGLIDVGLSLLVHVALSAAWVARPLRFDPVGTSPPRGERLLIAVETLHAVAPRLIIFVAGYLMFVGWVLVVLLAEERAPWATEFLILGAMASFCLPILGPLGDGLDAAARSRSVRAALTVVKLVIGLVAALGLVRVIAADPLDPESVRAALRFLAEGLVGF